jgi:TetR/AcrR family transcriptional regulator, cholesterol catabolism regulator
MAQPMKHQRVGPTSPLDQGTWQQILTAAKALFFAKGYKGVSMKEIADAVQVMPSALYYHFPKGKEELFTKMIQTLFVDEGVAGIDQALGTTQGLPERLTLLTSSLLALPIDEQFTMLLRDAREYIKDPENQRIILSLRDRIKQQVMGLFQAARDAGEIRTDIPVTMLVSLYMGMLREAKSPQGSRQAAQLVTVLLDGIASPEQQHQHERFWETSE